MVSKLVDDHWRKSVLKTTADRELIHRCKVYEQEKLYQQAQLFNLVRCLHLFSVCNALAGVFCMDNAC